MAEDVLAAVPSRRGHFRLESGLHTDRWLTLDALFVDPRAIAPSIDALADRLRPHAVTAVCGPLLGGAFLAQALATKLGVGFYYAEASKVPPSSPGQLFGARYDLPADQRLRVRGERVAVVDDAISAGSSVRATAAALASAGATIAVVAALLVLGDAAVKHFAGLGVPIEALERHGLALWKPEECPLCQSGSPLEDPVGHPLPGSPPREGRNAVTWVVLLYVNPGREAEFERFEEEAGRIMARYGGRIERRIPLRQQGDPNQPDEVHVVTFPDQKSFDRYRQDPEIQALAELRESAIRRTTLWHSL